MSSSDADRNLLWLMARDRAELLDLLRALSAVEWEQPTVAAPWVVRDVVAHIFGDDVSRLARGRDGHQVDAPGRASRFRPSSTGSTGSGSTPPDGPVHGF